jgi:transcriptional regulator with XRE-family HTH domain
MAKTTLEEITATAEEMRLYQQERAIEYVTAMIGRLMKAKKVSRTELAKLLGKSPGWITQLLDGEKNKTVRTLSDVLWALGESLEFDHKPLPTFSASPELQNGYGGAKVTRMVDWQSRGEAPSSDTSRPWMRIQRIVHG